MTIAARPSGPLLEVENLEAGYGPINVLHRLSLTVERGGRNLKRVEYTPQKGAKPLPALLLDKRPGEMRIETEANGTSQWVKTEEVQILKRVRFRWENYSDAWTGQPFSRYLLNTVFVTLCCIVGQVLTSSLVAFGFSRSSRSG